MSGMQSGADSGAGHVVTDMGGSFWGWCPKGRKAEDGPIPKRFSMIETDSDGYWQRTEANVRDSEATLIIAPREVLDGGTKRTAEIADRLGRPCMTLTVTADSCGCHAIPMLLWWLEKYGIRSLNVAGPRASKWAQAYDAAYHLVGETLHAIREKIAQTAPF